LAFYLSVFFYLTYLFRPKENPVTFLQKHIARVMSTPQQRLSSIANQIVGSNVSAKSKLLAKNPDDIVRLNKSLQNEDED
jgi:hypothetical protein